MTSLTEKVLKNIEQKHITPRPKWVFSLQNMAIWISGVLFIIVGGFAFSVVIYMLKDSDWYVYQKMGNNLWGFFLLMLPYFWLIILGVLVAIANYNLKVTKKGYRFRLRTVVAFVLVMSVLIGAFLYCAGVGKAIDETFADRLPFYEEFVNKMNRDKRIWMHPDRGLLAGVVISVDDSGKILVSDFNNDVWRIKKDAATVLHGMDLREKQAIKIVGQELEDNTASLNGEKVFAAKLIHVMPDPAFLKRHPMGPPRVIEVGSGIPSEKQLQNSFMHMEYQDEATTSLDLICEKDTDCQLPFMFAVRSNCPFEAKCLEDRCQVACPVLGKEGQSACDKKEDCDCASYQANDKIDCLCLDKHCLVIVQ